MSRRGIDSNTTPAGHYSQTLLQRDITVRNECKVTWRRGDESLYYCLDSEREGKGFSGQDRAQIYAFFFGRAVTDSQIKKTTLLQVIDKTRLQAIEFSQFLNKERRKKSSRGKTLSTMNRCRRVMIPPKRHARSL
jgi:hypothetical protein